MAKPLLNDAVSSNDYYPVLDVVDEYKSSLWDAWENRQQKPFEPILRQAIQDVEHTKNRHVEYNFSISYAVGVLDGWTELMEKLYRTEEDMKKVTLELSGQGAKARMVMECLYEHDGMRHGELAAAIGSSESSLSNIMKRMLLSGSVKSVRSGRNTFYYLSEIGKRCYEQQSGGGANIASAINACFSGVMDKLVEKICDTIEDRERISRSSAADMVSVPREFRPIWDSNILDRVEVGPRFSSNGEEYLTINTIEPVVAARLSVTAGNTAAYSPVKQIAG